MHVELTAVDASTNGGKIVLEKLPVMIGHSPDAGIRLDDHWVSRHHCEINVVKDTLVVRDLGSMLGTFVNGLNVTTARLMPGDKLTVGVTSFLVDYEPRNRTRRRRRTRTESEPSPPGRTHTERINGDPGAPRSPISVPTRRGLGRFFGLFHRAFGRAFAKPRQPR